MLEEVEKETLINRGEWSEAEELIYRALRPVTEHVTLLQQRWDSALQDDVTPAELEAYLQGKSDSSGPGPSHLRYGHVKHGSNKLKEAICVLLTAVLKGRLGQEEDTQPAGPTEPAKPT